MMRSTAWEPDESLKRGLGAAAEHLLQGGVAELRRAPATSDIAYFAARELGVRFKSPPGPATT